VNPMMMGATGIDPLAALQALATGQQPQQPQQQSEVESPLARALAYAQQQQAQLGPAPELDTSAMGDLARGQKQEDMAAALMGTQYVPDSGALGALAQVFSAYKGGKLDRKADETIADALKRQTEQQQAQAQYTAQRKAFDDGPGKILSMAERAKAAGYEPTAAELASGEFRKESAPKGFQMSGGFLVNKDTGETSEVDGYMSARERIAAAGRSGSGGGGSSVLSAEDAAQLGLPEGTIAQRDGKGKISILSKPDADKDPKALTPDQGMKASLLENAARAASAWQGLVLGDNGEFNDIKSRTPQAQSLLRQAIGNKLRAESGAAISAQEIENETERYLGGMMSSDATNSRQALSLTEDLGTQLGAFGEQGNAAFTRATAKPEAPKPAAAPITAGQDLGNGFTFLGARPAGK
jgi:hypothetical protein